MKGHHPHSHKAWISTGYASKQLMSCIFHDIKYRLNNCRLTYSSFMTERAYKSVTTLVKTLNCLPSISGIPGLIAGADYHFANN